MKISIRTIVPAALAGLLVGCAGEATPEMSIEGRRSPDPRQEYRDRADDFIQNYVPSEDAQPVVYAPEKREDADYAAGSAAVRKVYENVSLFRSAKKWESFSIEYRESSGKSVFRLSAERSSTKLRLESKDTESGSVLFAAEAEIPVVVQMPGGIPAEMAENVSREMNMIFQYLMNPLQPAKSVSMKTQPMINVAEKKLEDEPQEFLIGDCFCNRLEVVLKELYGGGLLYLYVSTGPGHEIRRIDFADLVLMTGGHGPFSLSFPAYTNREGHLLPEKAVLNGVEYTLSDFQVTLMPEPEPEPAAEGSQASGSEEKTGDSESEASESKEEESSAKSEDEEKTDAEAGESKEEGSSAVAGDKEKTGSDEDEEEE